MNQVIQLADHFVEALRKHLDPEQFVEVCKKNGTLEYQHSGVCASHDYCDANMVMLVAFVEVVGRDMIMEGGESPQEQADQALWNAAWEYAHKTKLRARTEPEYEDADGIRVAISSDDGEQVEFYTAGGGFARRLPREKFFEIFKPAGARSWRRATVTAEFLTDHDSNPIVLECWSDGSLWNGWGMPAFERVEVDRLMAIVKALDGLFPMAWDGDVVVVKEGEEPEETVRYSPTAMPNGQQAWDIGAGSWTWDRVKFKEEV
jgi:hypothetical protein